MASEDQRDSDIRTPRTEDAVRDGHEAQARETADQASDASRRQEAAHMRAPTPNEMSEETVAEIAAEAEARARE